MKEQIVWDARGSLRDEDVLISFIVPVFNTELFLSETLDSIACMGPGSIELIIVDDGSTDGSAARISDWMQSRLFPALHVRQVNAGLSAARMTGLQYARGEFVGFCDSDDRLDVATYLKLAVIARRDACDVAMCRSVVFDSVSQETQDFYDSALWEAMLQERHSVVINVPQEPRVLRLEPNANTRLLRRSFISKNALSFPLGLHFEDFPTHVDALAAAGKILLLDSTGYFYRVNRAGKITDQKSAKRFDMLKSAALALDAADKHHLSIQAKSYVLSMAARMIFWCGKNTLNKDRARFFHAACELIRKKVERPVMLHCIQTAADWREAVLLSALSTMSIGVLAAHAANKPISPFAVASMLSNSTFGARPRRIVMSLVLNKIKAMSVHSLSFVRG
jgi:glycosyltransferase involved in cell wall biosynthesis